MGLNELSIRAIRCLEKHEAYTGGLRLATRQAVKKAIESGEFVPTKYRHCGEKCAREIAEWAGATLPEPKRLKRRTTVEVLRDHLRNAVLSKAKTCEHSLVVYRQEADSYAIYIVEPDGTFRGEAYAEGKEFDTLYLFELAYLLEFGRDEKPQEV